MAACTEVVNLEVDQKDIDLLVVDGSITNDTMEHMIRLTMAGNYFLNQPAEKVSGAIVTVSEGDNTFLFSEKTVGSGEYYSEPDVYGIPGRTYQLSISLPEPVNGTTQYSAVCKMETINPVDSIGLKRWDDIGINGFYEVKIYVLDPPETNFYSFRTILNSRLLTDTITELFITDDRLYNGNYTNGIGVQFFDQSNPDETFHSGDTVTLVTSSITRSYYQFLIAVQTETSPKVPLFSGPPANAAGNISNGAVGFFTAYSNAYAKIIVP